MTLVKATIKSDNRVYVSIDIPGHGSDDTNFNSAKTVAQVKQENFPAFTGTTEEWEVLVSNSTEIRFERIGSN